jgi:hypothetical protein
LKNDAFCFTSPFSNNPAAFSTHTLLSSITPTFYHRRCIFDFGKKQRREIGSIEQIKPKTGPKQKLVEHRELLKQIVEATPDATLAEIRDQLPVHVSLPTVFKELRNLKHKKTS